MRIKQIIKQLYGSQAEFARRANIGTSTLCLALSGKYTGGADLRPRIEAAIREDFPDVDLSDAWGEEDRGRQTEDGKALEQCISALELLRSRLEGSNQAYLDIIIENLRGIA